MFVFKADNSEELKAEIIKWLNYNSSVNRSASMIAKNKTTKKEKRIRSETYQDIANFIQRSQIETKS